MIPVNGVLLARSIVKPILAMTSTMGRLADGDNEVEVPAIGRKDEIGEMAQAVQIFKENAIEKERLAVEQAEDQAQGEKRAIGIDMLTKDFDNTVSNALETMSSTASDMQIAAESMSTTAEETSRQSQAAAAASEKASVNVQTVSAAAEEMSSSINQIARQVAHSATLAKEAVEDAERTNETVQGLAEGSQKIGEVVRDD